MQMWHLFSKKQDQSDVEKYRPVSILPIFSKVYESCMYDQMYEYFNKILSKQQCGFRQGFSQAFDCLLHDLSIAKLAAYGFDYESLTLI